MVSAREQINQSVNQGAVVVGHHMTTRRRKRESARGWVSATARSRRPFHPISAAVDRPRPAVGIHAPQVDPPADPSAASIKGKGVKTGTEGKAFARPLTYNERLSVSGLLGLDGPRTPSSRAAA